MQDSTGTSTSTSARPVPGRDGVEIDHQQSARGFINSTFLLNESITVRYQHTNSD